MKGTSGCSEQGVQLQELLSGLPLLQMHCPTATTTASMLSEIWLSEQMSCPLYAARIPQKVVQRCRCGFALPLRVIAVAAPAFQELIHDTQGYFCQGSIPLAEMSWQTTRQRVSYNDRCCRALKREPHNHRIIPCLPRVINHTRI